MPTSLPGPWTDHEAQNESPWLSNQGIVKFIEFPVRKPALTRRAFHLYWQRHHSPHVMNATAFSQFMRKYMTGHVYPRGVEGLPESLQIPAQFEGVGEVWINSLEDAAAWLGHPLYAELISPDESHFIDANGVEVLVAREERLHDPDRDLVETGLTKLYVLARRKVGIENDQFHRAASNYGKFILSQPKVRDLLRRLVVSHRLRDPYPDWLPATDIDAVLEMWFDGRDALRQFFAEPAYRARIAPLQADTFDASVLRAVVTRLHVVHDEFSFQSTTMQPGTFAWDE